MQKSEIKRDMKSLLQTRISHLASRISYLVSRNSQTFPLQLSN